MPQLNRTKIIIGILIIGIVLISGWWGLRGRVIEKRIEIEGKLELVGESFPPLEEECGDFVNTNFKVGTYYLRGVCKKPYLVAALLEIVGEEIKVMGIVKEVEAAVPSEDNPEVLITKKFEVIEVEEITPPEIIMIATETNQYQVGEEVSVHLKHYLKKSVFVSFGPEGYFCAIKSIEKKDGEWKELPFSPPDCDLINLKEIKPYHLSGESYQFKIRWPLTLGYGQYRLKIAYKLAGEDDWKESYSNEFIVLKEPETEPIKDIGIKIDLKVKDGMVRINMLPPFAFLIFPGNYKLVILDKNKNVLWQKNINTDEIECYLETGAPEDVIAHWICDDSKIAEELNNISYQSEMSVFKMYYNEDLVAREYLIGAVIKGKVTDSSGNPVFASIEFCEKLSAEAPSCGSSYTDENGNYIIEVFSDEKTKLREGLYHLYIYPDPKLNLKQEFREINLKLGETKIVDITLKQCGSIAGKIADKEGNPITEAWVYEIGFETPRYHVCETEGECELGSFIIPDLEPGNYKIGAFVKIGGKKIDLQPKEVKVELGKTAIVNFVFEE